MTWRLPSAILFAVDKSENSISQAKPLALKPFVRELPVQLGLSGFRQPGVFDAMCRNKPGRPHINRTQESKAHWIPDLERSQSLGRLFYRRADLHQQIIPVLDKVDKGRLVVVRHSRLTLSADSAY
jgi:hypothetical protein